MTHQQHICCARVPPPPLFERAALPLRPVHVAAGVPEALPQVRCPPLRIPQLPRHLPRPLPHDGLPVAAQHLPVRALTTDLDDRLLLRAARGCRSHSLWGLACLGRVPAVKHRRCNSSPLRARCPRRRLWEFLSYFEANGGYVNSVEWPLYVFDALPIFVALVFYCTHHFGSLLRPASEQAATSAVADFLCFRSASKDVATAPLSPRPSIEAASDAIVRVEPAASRADYGSATATAPTGVNIGALSMERA